MKPPPFEYAAPATVDEALELLARYGEEAKLLAGGQSLIPVLNFRLARPAWLIDLNRITALHGISEVNGRLRIGAMTRQRDAERSPLVVQNAPLMAQAMPHIAHTQIRNRGTIGGSVAHADPAAELPAVMLALEATLHLRSATGERTLPARDFFTGLFSTALAADEMLVAIDLPPLPPGARCVFDEVARRHGDYALLGIAALLVIDADGACTDARLAYVNGGPGPVRAAAAEACLTGRPISAEVVKEAADLAAGEIRPGSDVHASAEYRRHLARVLTRRALSRAVQHRAQ